MIEGVESLDGGNRGNCTVNKSCRNCSGRPFAREQVLRESLGKPAEKNKNREG